MVRSLALAVALALGTVSIPAHALGLGDIKSKSALNQHFDADIDLLSVASGEMDAVRVRLASQEAFDRAGVERPFFLTLLKFRPALLDNGKTVITVSSDFPIREPFLNFLVEVNWPRGKLVREYTVLLDPPTTTKRRAPQVRQAPAAVEASRPAPAAPQAAPVQQVGEGEYGPIKAGDTLWSISKGLRPRGVTMSQMMIALQRANPQAFINGNINRLRKGQILRVPGTEEILSISRQEAQSSYRQQQDEYLTKRAEKLQEVAEQKAAEKPSGDSDIPSDAAAAAKEDAELRIAAPRPDGEGAAGAGEDSGDQELQDIEQQLLVARENAETSRLETEGLRGEIDDLQKRLQDMQRLLSLKDEQLARLQDNVAEGTTGLPEGAEDPLEAALRDAQQAVDTTGTPLEELSGAADKVAEEANARGLTAPTPAVAESVTEAAITKEEAPVEKAVSPAEDVKYPVLRSATIGADIAEAAPETEVQAVKEATAPDAPAKPEVAETAEVEKVAQADQPTEKETAEQDVTPPMTEEALGGIVKEYWPYLAGAAGLLVLLLLLVSRGGSKSKETSEGEPEDESILLDDQEVALDEDSALHESGAASGSDTSFLSEFSPSDINALRDDTGEVDAVSEADVYIAYGRYQQAEDLLRQGLERDPERLALKHKLLEVFYATRNKDAFASLAQELHDTGQDMADEEAWARAKDMGRELDESNALFEASDGSVSGGGAADLAESSGKASTAPGDINFDDFELDSLVSELNTPEGSVDEPSDLSLDDFDQDLEKALEEDSVIADDLESLELDLPDLDTAEVDKTGETGEAKNEEAGSADDSMLSVESDLNMDDLQAQLDELSELSPPEGEVSEMTEDAGTKPDDIEKALEDTVDAISEDALDKPLSLDDAFESDSLDDAQELAELDDAAGGVDEDGVGTKLDLARAYVEMGDSEGARSILQEVQKEGTSSQQEEATKLLSEIS